jgi:hypothetical protein
MPALVFTELERRTLGNLSIPRNADDLAAHVREHAPASAEQIDALLRGVLTDNGWVVKLGRHDDPAQLAIKAQKSRATMELPDEKAEIYARRMGRPDLAWRLDGDLWMLTVEGLAELHREPDNAPAPMTPTQVQAAVDAEWARVHRGKFVPGETSLANALLESEFHAWAKLVADDCKQRWNVRPVMPVAGGASGWSDAFETRIIDHENQKTAMPALVDPWFMALSILAFTDADTGTTADNGTHVPTYTGYARKSVAGSDMAAASSPGGSAANTSAITFAACTAGTSTILAIGNCSLVTVGELRKWADVSSTVISTTATPPTLSISSYTTTAA